MPFSSSVVWSGTLIAPQTGLYSFAILADDTGWITIDGKTVIADPGNVPNSQANGAIQLSAGSIESSSASATSPAMPRRISFGRFPVAISPSWCRARR